MIQQSTRQTQNTQLKKENSENKLNCQFLTVSNSQNNSSSHIQKAFKLWKSLINNIAKSGSQNKKKSLINKLQALNLKPYVHIHCFNMSIQSMMQIHTLEGLQLAYEKLQNQMSDVREINDGVDQLKNDQKTKQKLKQKKKPSITQEFLELKEKYIKLASKKLQNFQYKKCKIVLNYYQSNIEKYRQLYNLQLRFGFKTTLFLQNKINLEAISCGKYCACATGFMLKASFLHCLKLLKNDKKDILNKILNQIFSGSCIICLKDQNLQYNGKYLEQKLQKLLQQDPQKLQEKLEKKSNSQDQKQSTNDGDTTKQEEIFFNSQEKEPYEKYLKQTEKNKTQERQYKNKMINEEDDDQDNRFKDVFNYITNMVIVEDKRKQCCVTQQWVQNINKNNKKYMISKKKKRKNVQKRK